MSKLHVLIFHLFKIYDNIILLVDLDTHISEYLVKNPNDEFVQALYKFNSNFYGKIYTDWKAKPLRIYDGFQNEIYVYNFYKGQYREYVDSKFSKDMRKTDEKWACKIIINKLTYFGFEKLKELNKTF